MLTKTIPAYAETELKTAVECIYQSKILMMADDLEDDEDFDDEDIDDDDELDIVDGDEDDDDDDI